MHTLTGLETGCTVFSSTNISFTFIINKSNNYLHNRRVVLTLAWVECLTHEYVVRIPYSRKDKSTTITTNYINIQFYYYNPLLQGVNLPNSQCFKISCDVSYIYFQF